MKKETEGGISHHFTHARTPPTFYLEKKLNTNTPPPPSQKKNLRDHRHPHPHYSEAKEREKELAEQAEKQLGETLEEAGIRTRRQKQKGMVGASCVMRGLCVVWGV